MSGPLSLHPLSGRISFNISYNPRSVVHDLVVPTTAPGSPQVSYVPAEGDKPTFTGHPHQAGSLGYSTLWTHFRMLVFRNSDTASHNVTVAHRTSGSSYSNQTAACGPGTMAYITSNGLSSPGTGSSEDFKIHCSTNGAGLVSLHKSFFVIIPYHLLGGEPKWMKDFKITNSSASIFGETAATFPQGFDVLCYPGGSMNYAYESWTYPYLKREWLSTAVIKTAKVVSAVTTAGFSTITHASFYYPLNISYTPTIHG